MSNNAVIIFGGSGFVGKHLIRYLKNDRDFSVISVDIRDPSEIIDGVTYINGDVRNLKNLNFKENIIRIYNLAAVHTTPGHEFWEYYDTNVLGATSLVDFSRRHNVNDIVFTSSISVYGPGEEMKTEETPPAPESAYGWSKLMAEKIFENWYSDVPGRKLTVVRPAVVFGHGENGNFVRMAKMLRRGFFLFPGRDDTIKACIYVKDLIRFIEQARIANTGHLLFNGSYPDRYTIRQIVRQLSEIRFPKARTFMVPAAVLKTAAMLLRPIGGVSGIHPDRVTKLMKSTDVFPQWLVDHGLVERGRLKAVIEDWASDSNGVMD
jgi:nucleoside-diphosphate-sugar epimerase